MKIAGIIAEYNPLHTGHAYQIQKTREITGADYIIVALSGDFMQRGKPACLSKHHRANMALLAGADLVFELPSTHSCQSAELFAQSGIELFHRLACVDYVSFGSESGDITNFLKIGKLLADESAEYQQLLRMYLKTGFSFPAAREKALSQLEPSLEISGASILSAPNNILGIEYCKALFRLNSSIIPVTLERAGSGYHDLTISDAYPSASAIRKSIQNNGKLSDIAHCFPASICNYLTKQNVMHEFLSSEDFSLPLRWLLFSSTTADFEKIMDISPDLAQRILNERNHYENFSQFISCLKTKEVTHSRLTRALFHALLGIQSYQPIPYARLLAFRKSASCVLKSIKKNSSLPLLTKLADAPSLLSAPALQILEHNTRISNLYESVLCEKTGKKFVHEYQKELLVTP